jgi:hypothetical protein
MNSRWAQIADDSASAERKFELILQAMEKKATEAIPFIISALRDESVYVWSWPHTDEGVHVMGVAAEAVGFFGAVEAEPELRRLIDTVAVKECRSSAYGSLVMMNSLSDAEVAEAQKEALEYPREYSSLLAALVDGGYTDFAELRETLGKTAKARSALLVVCCHLRSRPKEARSFLKDIRHDRNSTYGEKETAGSALKDWDA